MVLKFKIGDPYDKVFSVSVRVTQAGHFTCTLPPDIAALYTGKIRLNTGRRGSNVGYFSADTLEGLRAIVDAKLTELCSETLVLARDVIRFKIHTACVYGITKDGQYIPTSQGSPSGWHDGTVERHATSRGPFGLWFYVGVYTKSTYRYAATGTERVEYTSLYDHNYAGDYSDDIQWLCNLHSIAPDSSRRDAIKDQGDLSEIPATPENLKFFVGLCKWLFGVNERIKPFLNPEGVIKLAQMADNKLLGTGDK